MRSGPVEPTGAGHTYLRLARQIDALVHEATAAVDAGLSVVTIPIAVNADSLATWLLPALATLPPTICLDLQCDDQAHTAELLRSGAVVAAITSVAEPVQGCRSTRLGVMRYRPVASPAGLAPPRHHVPASADFASAVRLGLGWGTLPRQQGAEAELAGQLLQIDPGRHVDVTLHWQQWALRTPALDAVAAATRAAAADHLDTVE